MRFILFLAVVFKDHLGTLKTLQSLFLTTALDEHPCTLKTSQLWFLFTQSA